MLYTAVQALVVVTVHRWEEEHEADTLAESKQHQRTGLAIKTAPLARKRVMELVRLKQPVR